LLVKRLLGMIPEHRVYVEAFAGGAKLLFAKEPSAREIINDVHAELMNFYLVAKYRPSALAERLKQTLVHPEEFTRMKAAAQPACEVDRALVFAYRLWWSFGAKGVHYAWPGLKQAQSRRCVHGVRQMLRQVSARMERVEVDHRDFADAIARYDSAETFFFCDPPYECGGRNFGQYRAGGGYYWSAFCRLPLASAARC
jgi:DNA adenine methylase